MVRNPYSKIGIPGVGIPGVDPYQSNTMKNVTREERGMGVKIVFKEEGMLPDDPKDFVLNGDIKKNFYQIIQKQAANLLFWEWTGEV